MDAATDRRRRLPSAAPLRLKITAWALLALTFVQLYLGALVAGLRAGKIYNTWPDIDGGFIPSAARLFFDVPWWRNLFENTLTVQFEHRMVAYTLFVLAVLHAVDACSSRADRAVIDGALWLLGAVALQGDPGYPHAAQSGTDGPRARPSGSRDRGADVCGLSAERLTRSRREPVGQAIGWLCHAAWLKRGVAHHGQQ